MVYIFRRDRIGIVVDDRRKNRINLIMGLSDPAQLELEVYRSNPIKASEQNLMIMIKKSNGQVQHFLYPFFDNT